MALNNHVGDTNEKKTAVEFLVEKIKESNDSKYCDGLLKTLLFNNDIEKAKQIEKEQKDAAYQQGYNQQKINTTTQKKAEKIIKSLGYTSTICCGVFEIMEIIWIELEDGSKCMPSLKSNIDKHLYRVNNCPSCGAYVRDVIIAP